MDPRPDIDHHRRTRRRLGRRAAAAIAGAALVLTGVGAATGATRVVEKNVPGGLVAVGPVSGDNGFPAWYEDSSHTRVELCLDDTNPLCGFLPGDIPDETTPISFPDNFPEEAFYMLAGSELDLPGGGRAVLTLGLEAAFANTVSPGDQMVFARQRIVVKGAPANTTLTFHHPYGVVTIDTDDSGAGKLVEDVSPAVGNFSTPLKGNIGPFLKWDTGAPDGYLGNPDVTHAVTGSPTGFNRFAVAGGGLDVSTDQFTVQGKVSTNSGVDAQAAVVTGDMLDVFATSGDGAQLEVVGEPGSFETTPMATDPGSGRYYARIKLTGAPPARVKVTNISDKPASSSIVDVSRPSGIVVTQADYDGTRLTVAASSRNGYPLHVVGVPGGDLTDATPASFTVTAPPGSVTVKNDDGGSATLPVTITGGSGMPAALPPVTPAPDPGPVVETGPGGSGVGSGPVASASAASTSVARGASTQLDGSASTGATSYQWSQLSGPPVTLSSTTAAKPTVTVPFSAKTTDTSPAAPAPAGPARLQLTVTGADPGQTSTATVDLTVVTDAVTVDSGSRHRLGSELRVSGTSTLPGTSGVLVPATSVLVFDTTPGRPVTKLGNAPVDTLGAWSLKAKPGPTRQVTSVLVQSTRGGTATSQVATK